MAELENIKEVRIKLKRPSMSNPATATQRTLRRNHTFDTGKKPTTGLNKTVDAEREQQDTMIEDIDISDPVFLETMSENQLRDLHNDLRLKSEPLMQKMKSLKSNLTNANGNIHIFLRNAQNKMNEVFTCKNCCQKFTMMHNQEKLCVFHPGRIKFFSCNKCDNDEYFTCCHECGDCSKGCKQSYHVPFTAYNKTKL